MRKLLVAILLLLATVAVLGFYRGWFRVSTDNTDQKPSATITVDQNKIKEDEDKARQSVRDFGHKTTD